ncbi:hypothetical protein HHI36_009568 [Cryptolaemus montrouzieri]|uniref:Uncharacterized protein n=1 Tax=Cryptolaemus montrouzieri TaxID=559131 RepID=A0ABD2MG45_9CUCU
MNLFIMFVFALLAVVSAIPLDPQNIVADSEGNLYYNQLVPLSRVRRDQGGSYIKAGAAHSSKYGSGGQIVANKNLSSGKHHTVDAQVKYNQFGSHREGWAGINYGLRW